MQKMAIFQTVTPTHYRLAPKVILTAVGMDPDSLLRHHEALHKQCSGQCARAGLVDWVCVTVSLGGYLRDACVAFCPAPDSCFMRAYPKSATELHLSFCSQIWFRVRVMVWH